MRFLPLVFGIVLLRFPAGLFVYWVTSNIISIFQNLLIYRNVPKSGVEDDEPEAADADGEEQPDGYRAKTETGPPSQPVPNSNGAKKTRTKKRR